MSEVTIEKTANFAKWRKRLWPVYNTELNSFLPLFILKFCVTFNYTILAATKDTIVVTAKGGGAEVIPVLKGGVVIIIACLVMLGYSKLCNKVSRNNVFYIILYSFMLFFLLYGLVFFPYKDLLSPHQSADWLLYHIGVQHKHWIAVYRYWMDSLFFVLAELWGAMMIGILFWGLANHINNVKNAARFYTLYTVGGQIGAAAAGMIVYYYSNVISHQFATTVAFLMKIVVLMCFVIGLIYWWTNRYVVKQKQSELIVNIQDDRTKLSLKDSLLFIIKSKYLGLIAFMVIGYGISVNMVEVSWKAMLKLQFPDPADYQTYMGVVQTILGIISLLVALLLGGNFIRRYGWYASAQLTPIIISITSLLFFILYYLFPDYASNNHVLLFANNLNIKCMWILTPLGLLVLAGTIHNIACKTMKYCLFDTTKEMAYIPLEREAKIKGKAAVDLVGARLGKSGASWTQLVLIDLIGAGSILGALPLLFPVVSFILIFWLFAVHKLNKRFLTLQMNPNN